MTLATSKVQDSEELVNLRIIDAITAVLKEKDNITVHLIPGENDYTNCALPQQPIHGSFLEQLWKSKRLNLCTNPCRLKLPLQKGKYFLNVLGHSGQPIHDLLSYTIGKTFENPLILAELSLQWRHMAPTAPDTLCKS